MKSLLIFTCVVMAVHGVDKEVVQKLMGKIQKIVPPCIDESKASDSDLQELMEHKLPPSTHEGKCLISCIQKHVHVLNEDGSIGDGDPEDWEKVKSLDEDFYNKMMTVHKACKESVKPEPDFCETGTNFMMCAREETKKLGITSGDMFES